MTPSLGLINLLEQLTGLRNICFHLPYIGNYKVAYYRGYYEGYRWAYVCLVKAMVFLVVMYRCGSWTIKKAEAKELMLSNFGAGEDPESPLDSKQIKPLNPKGNQPWIFIERTDWCWRCSSNTLATWCKEPTHWKRPSCWERLRARGEGGWQRMRWLDGITGSTNINLRVTEDEMVGWHHWLNEHKFEQTLGDSEGQGNVAFYSPFI